MRSASQVLAITLTLSLGAVGAVLLSRATRDERPGHVAKTETNERPSQEKYSTALPSSDIPKTPPAPPRAAPTAAPDPARELRDVLTWTDDAARIDGISAAVSRGGEGVLPVLTSVELARDPEAAPTIIQAIAAVAAKASASERRDATKTLGRWLSEETRRANDDAADARGNVSLIVEALGQIGGAEAVDTLVAALDSKTLPLHVETLAVQGLRALGDPRAEDAIAAFALRVNALPKAEGLDGELREEALLAANSR